MRTLVREMSDGNATELCSKYDETSKSLTVTVEYTVTRSSDVVWLFENKKRRFKVVALLPHSRFNLEALNSGELVEYVLRGDFWKMPQRSTVNLSEGFRNQNVTE